MEKIQETGQQLLENSSTKILEQTKFIAEKGKTIVSNTLNLSSKDIGKKIFDNMVWVFILVGVLILIYLSYLLTQTFNIDSKIQKMNKEYKFVRKVNLSTPSESQEEQDFDEIKTDKHTLCDVYICSSAKSYLSGRQVLDYVSKEMFFTNIKLGARYVELDLFEDRDGNVVVSNGLFQGNWMLTLNKIYFEDFCRDIATKVFNKEYTSNYNDPFLIYLGLNLPKEKMNLVAKIIKDTLKKHLVGDAFTLTGKRNVIDTKLEELLGKIIFITDGKIAKTELVNYIHLRIGNKVRRISYDTFLLEDKERLKQFNKSHLTIVVPNPDISSINFNPQSVFESGCQIIAMNFQYVGDHMKAYLAHFHEKSFILKPFEFTKFSDLPQNGYDPDKIAYYENYEILKKQDATGENDPTGNLSNDYNRDSDSIFFKNNIGYEKPNLKHGCCKIFLEDQDIDEQYPVSDIDVSITNMIKKLHEFNLAPDPNYNSINNENKDQMMTLLGMNSPSPSSLTVQEIQYQILLKQMKKLMQEKREELFKAGMKDPCHGLDDKCSSNPMCYFKPYELTTSDGSTKIEATSDKCNDGRIIYQNTGTYYVRNKEGNGFKSMTSNYDTNTLCAGGTGVSPVADENIPTLNTNCESSLSSIPFPKLCLPKYISSNRNMCLSSSKDKQFIDSKGIRQIFHEKMTAKGFSGKWNSYLGQIFIPNEFNSQCEFTFKTNFDNKEYTLFMVDYDGKYFKYSDTDDNFITNDNTYKLRAKGTFVDPSLRLLEQENKLPEMPYHGFIEIKMDDYQEKAEEREIPRECLNNKFIGIYKYSDKVYRVNPETVTNPDEKKIISLYSNRINKIYEGEYNNTGMVLGLNQGLQGNENSANIFCYKVLSDECLSEGLVPSASFDRPDAPSFILGPSESESEIPVNQLLSMTSSLGLEFTEAEIEGNPSLRRRIVGMIRGRAPEMIEEYEQEAAQEREERQPEPEVEQREEIEEQSNLFIFHTTNQPSSTITKPGDTFQISGIDGDPFCIQRMPSDIGVTDCNENGCKTSTAYIGTCKNNPDMQDPFCENIDAAHNIQIQDDGEEGDNRTQRIRSLNTGDASNPVDACLSYDEEGNIVYAHCNASRNRDRNLKSKWRVYRLEGENNFKITSTDGKCLTRVPFNNKDPKDLIDGLYEKDKLLSQSFASTKLMDCTPENENNQRFEIKYMGDTQNCKSEDDIPEVQPVDMNARQKQRRAERGGKRFIMKD